MGSEKTNVYVRRVFEKDEKGQYHDTGRREEFQFELKDGRLYLEKKGSGTVPIKVRKNSEFVIKQNKTGFSAIGGAPGLFGFLKEAIEGDTYTGYVNGVCDICFPD